MKKSISWKVILNIIVLIIVLILAIVNWQSVTINFVLFKLSVPLFLLVVVILLIGLLIGWTFKQSDIKKVVNKVSDK